MALRKALSILNLSNEDMGTAMYSTTFELLYFKRDIAHMLPEHLKAVQESMSKLSSNVDLKKLKKEQMPAVASCLVIEGAVLRGLKENDTARKNFLKTLSMEQVIPLLEGKHWMVAALYELGEMEYRDGKLKEAEEYLTRASKYSGYDWEDVYKSRLQKALNQIKKENKESKEIKEKKENVKTE